MEKGTLGMKDATDVTIILDRSGSMEAIREATMEGFNSFIAEQAKVPSECTISLVQFDHEYEITYFGKPAKDATKLSYENFVPRGRTALLDAIGRTVNAIGARLANMPEHERPARVVVAIMTDGDENDSKEFNKSQIDTLLKNQQEKYSWQIIFLGANQDAIKTAKGLGINVANAMSYAGNSQGAKSALRGMSLNVASYAGGLSSDTSFSVGQRQEQETLLKAQS